MQRGKQLKSFNNSIPKIQVKIDKPKDSVQWSIGLGRLPSKHKNLKVKVQNDMQYMHPNIY